jgi:hypothetical protein
MKKIVWMGLMLAWMAGLLSGQATQKTAGEAFKNVVVLRDTPQTQFLSAMQLISGGLGVQCTYCHAQPFDSDTKPAKVTARNMIKMTLEINAKNFGGKQVVGCNTCHQGATHPNALPAVWDKTGRELGEYKRKMESAVAPPSAVTGEALPSADEVVAAYRKAVGIDLAKSMHVEGFVTSDLTPRPRPIEGYAILPDRITFAATVGAGQSKLLINADHAWAITPQGAQDIPLEQARSVSMLVEPMKIVSSDAKREVTGIEQVDGRSCFRVVTTAADFVSRLYFDKQNGLLYKTHTEYRTPLGPEPSETAFDDYADVSGIKMPFTITRSSLTDRAVYRFWKIEANVAVDAAKFEPPPAKK